jgi:hypothetical protein
MSITTFKQPDFTTDTGTEYKDAIDSSVAVLARTGAGFACHQQDVADMTVRIDAGSILSGTTLTEVTAQDTSTITAPSSDPRIDRVVLDPSDGTVSVVTGTEDASPTAPAITSGHIPLCKIALTVGQTEIVNADITDERASYYAGGGAGGSQCVQTVDTTNRSTSSSSIADTGVQVIVTPTSASSKVLVTVQGVLGNGDASSGRVVYMTVDRNGTNLGPAGVDGNFSFIVPGGTGVTYAFSFSFLDSPSTTSAVTYKFRWQLSTSGVTIHLGRRGADTAVDCPTIITAQETS